MATKKAAKTAAKTTKKPAPPTGLATKTKESQVDLWAVDDWMTYLKDQMAMVETGFSGPTPLEREAHKQRWLREHVYQSKEDLLLKHGRVFRSRPLPKPYRRTTAKACFDNAYELAAASEGRLRYVEGLATANGVPMPHGWCVDEHDLVVDPTLTTPAEVSYFGVVIALERVRWTRDAPGKHLGQTREMCTSVLDDWPHGHPVLKEPFTESATAPRSPAGIPKS